MVKTRKICIVTGSRAEYGLLHHIMQHLRDDPSVEMQIIVTGMHLSSAFGDTWRQIEADGFPIDRKVEMLLPSDTMHSMAKSTGIGLSGIADALQELAPDLILVLGDRFEILSAVVASALMRIPVAHVHGGESTEGAVDDSIRHAITKLSHLHFTSTEPYRNRVIQMGEAPHRVFCFGAPGIDSIASMRMMDREELAESMGFDPGKRYFLITYHPVTLGDAPTSDELAELLFALTELPEDVRWIFTMPNADAGGRALARQINTFVSEYFHRAAAFTNLGQQRYLSAMKHCVAVVGNSSSGIIEAPTLGVGVVNIGDRQKGRIQASSVINCPPRRKDILEALTLALEPSYRATAAIVHHPYGGPGASEKIAHTLATYPLEGLARKPFHDIPLS